MKVLNIKGTLDKETKRCYRYKLTAKKDKSFSGTIYLAKGQHDGKDKILLKMKLED